jgi:hypothetical protein
MSPVTAAVTDALPVPVAERPVDLHALQLELDGVAACALEARRAGVGLDVAVRDPRWPALVRFHRDLQDALFVETTPQIEGWFSSLTEGDAHHRARLDRFAGSLATTASGEVQDTGALSVALAELLVFEAVRLRLCVAAWSNEDFERTGGHDQELDAVAWAEVDAILHDPELRQGGVRPLQVMFASAFVSLARNAHRRVDELRRTSEDVLEQLSTRARLRGALRELRLPEAVLLENALSNLLGEERVELAELQEAHPLALEGLSRQAMDQRVSRSRRQLGGGPQHWPRRRRPALFDLLRERR